MEKAVFENVELADLKEIAKNLLPYIKEYKIALFTGQMGAGKTTLIKAIVEELGSKDEASSPTFSLVNEYMANNQSIYHFDLYRLKDFEEALDIGIEEYLYSQSICLIEWPELIESILTEKKLTINITSTDENKRNIKVEAI
jgi:tRNA threonylcarbamoyladenosine biosynthesis protein TsaE